MKTTKETYRCVIKIYSPVHLGCDDVYEPTGFVVDEESGRLTALDPLLFIKGLSNEERESLSQICRKGSIESVLEVYKFFRGKTTEGRQVDLCKGFVDHYRRVLALSSNPKDIGQNLNQFQIARTAYKSHDNRPYIPGTAVKGAIRTAYLNALAGKKKIPTPKGKYASNELQSRLIGYESQKMETDPFRLVKVSDFMPVGKIQTRIVYAVNKKKKLSDREARGPYQILEVIEPGACFTGEVSVERPPSAKYIQNPATLEAILVSLNPFFQRENQRECRQLNAVNIDGISLMPEEGQHVLRIGRHSGAESITVAGHRKIRIMLEKKQDSVYKDQATTFWLASESEKSHHDRWLKPFGWAIMEPLPPELEDQLCGDEDAFVRQERAVEKQRLAEIARMQDQAAKERRKAEQLQREKEETARREEERKAALEAMTPEERDVATLENPGVIENTVVQIYNRLADFSDTNKVKAAAAIKKYYQAHGKWHVSKKKKKQLEKVNKLKEILGE